MLLIAKIEMGIIRPGMRFALITEEDDYLFTFCIELQMNFRISKDIIAEKFDFRY